MRTTLHATLLYLLSHLSTTGYGQDNSGPDPFPRDRALHGFHYAELSDSTDFLRFIQSLRAADGPPQAGATPKRYRQVWLVSEHGGFSVVSRGDGEAITVEAERPIVAIFNTWSLNLLTSEGRACIAQLWDRPCAMICRTTTYYVEE